MLVRICDVPWAVEIDTVEVIGGVLCFGDDRNLLS